MAQQMIRGAIIHNGNAAGVVPLGGMLTLPCFQSTLRN